MGKKQATPVPIFQENIPYYMKLKRREINANFPKIAPYPNRQKGHHIQTTVQSTTKGAS